MHIILYGVYLVFEGLSFRAASRALEFFTRRSHVSIGVGSEASASGTPLPG